jgi:hypothetical protein
MQDDMIVTLPPGTKLYRGRISENLHDLRKKVESNLAGELGPAPNGLSAAGRLNAQGFGLSYGADDVETAVAEIALHSLYSNALVGAFEVQKPLTILDFTRTPRPGSPFVEKERLSFAGSRRSGRAPSASPSAVQRPGVLYAVGYGAGSSTDGWACPACQLPRARRSAWPGVRP